MSSGALVAAEVGACYSTPYVLLAGRSSAREAGSPNAAGPGTHAVIWLFGLPVCVEEHMNVLFIGGTGNIGAGRDPPGSGTGDGVGLCCGAARGRQALYVIPCGRSAGRYRATRRAVARALGERQIRRRGGLDRLHPGPDRARHPPLPRPHPANRFIVLPSASAYCSVVIARSRGALRRVLARPRQSPRCRRGLRSTSIEIARNASAIRASERGAPPRRLRARQRDGAGPLAAITAVTGIIAATRLRGAR